MIYVIETNGKTIALTNEADYVARLNAGGKYGALTCRWASEAERTTFRRLALAHQSKWWPVLRRRFAVALCWVWNTSFPPMHSAG